MMNHLLHTTMFLVLLVSGVGASKIYYPKDFPSAYMFVSTQKDMASAARYCKLFSFHLVAMETEYEHAVVWKLTKLPENRNHIWWTSGTDASLNGHWIWSSNGKDLTYTAWAPREPNNSGKGEDCLEIRNYAYGITKCWNDRPCAFKARFICEKELTYPEYGGINATIE